MGFQIELFKRFLLHAVLLTFITIKIFDWNYINASYGRALSRTYLHLFGTDAMIESILNNQIYTYDEFEIAIRKVYETYQNLPSLSVAPFAYGYRDQPNSSPILSSSSLDCRSNEPQALSMTTYYWSDSTTIHHYEKEVRTIDDLDFIFNNTEAYFASLDSLQIAFDLCNYQYQSNSFLDSSQCNYWEVHLNYRFIAQLYVEVIVESRLASSCSPMSSLELMKDYISVLELFTIFIGLVYGYYIFKVGEAFLFTPNPFAANVVTGYQNCNRIIFPCQRGSSSCSIKISSDSFFM